MRFFLPIAVLLFSFASAGEVSALEESEIPDTPELALAVGELAIEVAGSGIDPKLCPEEFKRKLKNPWYDPPYITKVPEFWDAIYKKVPCPGDGAGVCYSVDIYEPCGLFRLGRCYKGSVIIRIDLVDGFPGLWVYHPDGTYLWGFWFEEGRRFCMTSDGGMTTECYDKSCFERVPNHRNPFKIISPLSPLLPSIDLLAEIDHEIQSSEEGAESCSRYPFPVADAALETEELAGE